MSDPIHSFGPTCIFHDDETTHPTNSPHPPHLRAQFFYVSSIPIDDPLSPLPPISSDSKSSQSQQPQPFSLRDNAALAEAWQSIEHLFRPPSNSDVGSPVRPPVGERGRTLGELVRFPRFKADGKSNAATTHQVKDQKYGAAVSDPREPGSERLFQSGSSSSAPPSSPHQPKPQPPSEAEVNLDRASGQMGTKKYRRFSPFRKTKAADEDLGTSGLPVHLSQADSQTDTDISGHPFARTPISSPGDKQDSKKPEMIAAEPLKHMKDGNVESQRSPAHPKPRKREEGRQTSEDENAFIPVGVSRLHLVEMPDLLMKPIYWSPVNDVSAVLRGTWFYVSNMLPVEPELANWLETGYLELKPWTDTWQDELNSCVDIGAEAEMKVVYRLYPERPSSRASTAAEAKADRPTHAQPRRGSIQDSPVNHESLAAGPQMEKFRTWATEPSQRYRNHQVIYINASQAQILRPSLGPSATRKRKPLAAVRKGREIGVPVVRGFNRRAWEKLNPTSRMNVRAAHAKVGAFMSQSGNAGTQGQHISCPACKIDEQSRTPQVTDLILVIHGIGQKLSEKMDSFHFTHAINSFRREINVALSNEVVHGNVRRKQGGIMVLPVNWRLTVSFDDGVESQNNEAENRFQLEDITPETLPAIRSLISDVMLDIPYYLSHHKQKMVAAVIREANRVYRLWCRNNPGFQDKGRVHLIAHSLGSAMAMDILSQQPTRLPKSLHVPSHPVSQEIFEFDTKSLFCCGSPAGFFLLLNKTVLIPRGGRQKAGFDEEEEGGDCRPKAGMYGCLAVDNLYNVMAPYDPISYRLNAAVDSQYAASLQPAIIPSLQQGLLASIGLKWGPTNSTKPFGLATSAIPTTAQRPAMNKLPSTIEMDTHNFTREEIAEKRMFLLNDNGQIDFTLSNDGGPLDFQYWNMLSAHSSYWLRLDFVRFLVVEIGRDQGRQGTLTALTAKKRRVFKPGKIA